MLISIKFILGDNSFSLEISKSKSFNHTNSGYTYHNSFFNSPTYTPFVIKMKSENKNKIVKGVDIIALADISQSMRGKPFELMKLTLMYLINIMNENDNFSLVSFSYFATLVHGLSKMTEENKKIIIDKINNLKIENYTDIYQHGGVDNGTDIMEGLKLGMNQITQNYSSGERIASIFVLSDGAFNYYYDFLYEENAEFIKNEKKNSTFTIHYLGMSNYINYYLLHMLSFIKDGGFFFIPEIHTIKDVISKLYNSLSNVESVNIKLSIESNFYIRVIYGIDGVDLYDNSFNYEIIHFLYNTTYTLIIFLYIPEDINIGDVVLKASISPLKINETYRWDTDFNPNNYENMIKFMYFDYINRANANLLTSGENILYEGKYWIKRYYNGTKNWINQYDNVLDDLKNYEECHSNLDICDAYGRNNIYARLREMQSPKIGAHYIVKKINGKFYYYIDNEDDLIYQNIKIINEINLPYEYNKNYYFYKVGKGYGKINNIFFSGFETYIIIFTEEKTGNINIKPLSEYIEYTCLNETRIRNINNFDLNQGGKFISQKDFPLEFYSEIDGTNDINFNIQFLKLEKYNIEIKIYLIEIIAYIIDETEKDLIYLDKNYIPNKKVYNGSYYNELKLGLISIKKEEILKYVNDTYKSYIYIIVNKPKISTDIYNYIEGQFLFSSPNYINTQVPEDFFISNYFSVGENYPHLYSLFMEQTLGKYLTIELIIFGIELDIKILKYNNYTNNLEELYEDYGDYLIKRREKNNIQYIDIYQSTDIYKIFYYIIISIFPKNKDHIAGKDIQKFSYSFKYMTYSYKKQRYNYSDIEEYQYQDENNTKNDSIKNNTLINYISNSIEPSFFTDLETTIKKSRKTYKLIILGFSSFIHIKIIKICYFSLHFTYIKQHINDLNLYTSIIIKYKINLNIVQEVKEIKCILIKNNEFDSQIDYNCSFETNGSDIYSLQLINKFKFEENDIEIIASTPYVNKFINNITNIGNNNIFYKRLYILSNIILLIDNKNNKFDIIGNLNHDEFSYEKINLMINLLSFNYSIINNTYIPCKIIKSNENKNNTHYTFQCFSEKALFGIVDGAFAELGDANLVIMPGNNSTIINFTEKIEEIKIFNNIFRTKEKSGLSTGGKLAIIFSMIGVLAAVTIIIVLIKTKTIYLNPPSETSNIIINKN